MVWLIYGFIVRSVETYKTQNWKIYLEFLTHDYLYYQKLNTIIKYVRQLRIRNLKGYQDMYIPQIKHTFLNITNYYILIYKKKVFNCLVFYFKCQLLQSYLLKISINYKYIIYTVVPKLWVAWTNQTAANRQRIF